MLKFKVTKRSSSQTRCATPALDKNKIGEPATKKKNETGEF